MTDGSPRIIPVTDDNIEDHTTRWHKHRLRKSFLKAKDRRKNFEQGEIAGFLYCLGLLAIIIAASERFNDYELQWWLRCLSAIAGASALVGKTYIKRRFWKQTEDAEYNLEEDEHDTNRQER